jgi:YVTN family beta-propeller protein
MVGAGGGGKLRVNRPRLCSLGLGLILLGCQASLSPVRPRLEDEGAVYLYLQPLPREAARLRVGMAGVSALSRDGREVPLSLSLRELSGRDVRRQRLLAAGPLPAGEYSGLVFRARSAALRGDGEESALLVPDAPTRIDFTFVVRRREAHVIALSLRYAESVDAGFRFSPVFSVYRPARPAVGLMGFVANRRSNDITVFDKKSLDVFDVIATGSGPSSLALDQRTRKLYAALSEDDTVEVIDLMAGKITDQIRLTLGDQPVALALTPDGKVLLSANMGSNTVSFIDPGSRVELTKIPVGNGPRFIAIDRTGRRAFAFNTVSNTVSVIDILGRGVIRAIPTDPDPVRGDFNRRGDRLYVIHQTSPFVTVINPDSGAVTGRFPVRTGMDAIKVDPNTDLVYLGAKREPAVGVYEPFSFVPVDFLDTGAGVAHMATDADENALYLVSPDTNRVVVSHRIRRRIAGELDAGEGPSWISLMGEN